MSDNKDLQMSEYNFKGFSVRSGLDQNGNIWFVAKDVCDVLEIVNVSDAISRLEERYKDKIGATDSVGRLYHMAIIAEPALYELISVSRKPEAKAFKAWVYEEVLISIRKHGAYIEKDIIDQWIDDPDYGIRLLTALKKEREAKKQVEKKVEYLETQLGFTTEYASIKRVSIALGKKEKDYDWRLLKRESITQQKEMPKVDDANYDKVNTYHAAVWKAVYGINLSELKLGR